MSYRIEATPTRVAASFLVFVMFVSFSYLTYTYMAANGYPNWYQVLIPVSFEWLSFVGLMKLLWDA